MKPGVLLAVLILAAAGVYAWRSRSDLPGESIDLGDWSEWTPSGIAEDVVSAADSVLAQGLQIVDEATGGLVKVSRMREVTAADMGNANVQAMLRVIRTAEGTADPDGYRRLFGGALFSGYADHPRQLIRKSGYSTTAAGAYQFLTSTWDETARTMGLRDFSPASQDMGAVGRLAARGALADVKAGRFDAAVVKIAKEWASLPGSPYGQPTISAERARSVFLASGGAFSMDNVA